MNFSEYSPLDILVENKIDVEAELEALELRFNINSRDLSGFYVQFPLISKVYYACGLKSCLEEYQDMVDGNKEDSIVLFKHETSRNVIDTLYDRVALFSSLEPQISTLNGEELFHNSFSYKSYLYQLFCIGYFKANLILEGNTDESFETYRKCCAYVLLNTIDESWNELRPSKEKKLVEELDRINILVDMFKIYSFEIPSLLLEKKRIIETILTDNKKKPICKSFSDDELFNVFGIIKPDIQEELDEL